MARALLDLERATLGAGLETLQRRPLVHEGVLDVEVLLIEELAVAIGLHLSVGDRGVHELVDRLGGALLRELQDGEGFLRLLALDEGDDTTSLLRGHADVLHACDGFDH